MASEQSLVELHRIISEQLNSRLSESPRFFWTVVVAGAGYGYVLWNYPAGPGRTAGPYQETTLILASLGAYGIAFFAQWYLAALGYAFRFLQKTQHDIEDRLNCDHIGLPRGDARGRPCRHPLWLLPSIYQPHAYFLLAFMVTVAGASRFVFHTWALTGAGAAIAIAAIYLFNAYYHCKYLDKLHRAQSGGPKTGPNTGPQPL